MKNPNEWYSQSNTGLAAAFLIIIGTWSAIILLPTIFAAIAIFVLIGGPGLFIAYKQKHLLLIIGVTTLIPAWAYFWIIVAPPLANYALSYYLGTIAFIPLVISGFITLVWLILRKCNSTSKVIIALKKPVLFMFFALLVVVPFVVAGLNDYNMRADASMPEPVNAKIVAKYNGGEDGDIPWMWFETLDGNLQFRTPVYDWQFYDGHEEGDYCVIIIRNGGLGYPWMEGYND